MQLTVAGTIARQCWEEIPDHFPNVALDEFVIMPDDMHGIIILTNDDDHSRRGLINKSTTSDSFFIIEYKRVN